MWLRCFSMTTKGNCKTFVRVMRKDFRSNRTKTFVRTGAGLSPTGYQMATSGRVYLDHNATSPLRAEVALVMARALELPGNPSSVHAEGREARAAIEAARDQVAALVGARAKNVTFTSGGTEAYNMVLSPTFRRLGGAGCRHADPGRHRASVRVVRASVRIRPGRDRPRRQQRDRRPGVGGGALEPGRCRGGPDVSPARQ